MSLAGLSVREFYSRLASKVRTKMLLRIVEITRNVDVSFRLRIFYIFSDF